MSVNYIPNDPLAAPPSPPMRTQPKRSDRPKGRAGFQLSGKAKEGAFAPGTPEFVFWQSREAAIAAVEAWESSSGLLTRWQGNRAKLKLIADAGVDLNAFYDRKSFSFFHQRVGKADVFSGDSTDVVAHELGHGILDAIRPELWNVLSLEVGAFHEAYGDCVAILTALTDAATRQSLLGFTADLRTRNFVESTAEHLAGAIRRLFPSHNAAEPRHALNNLRYQLPETLPDHGGPGVLINEVHSFGMIFSGCFYDLIANVYRAGSKKTAAALLNAARHAMRLLVAGVRAAPIVPRFFRSVGRAMELADQQLNAGANREHIRAAFDGHGIALGANALLAPAAALDGGAPKRAFPFLGPSTRRDLRDRLHSPNRARLSMEAVELFGEPLVRATHQRDIDLGDVDARLRGVMGKVVEPVLIGASGKRAALVGHVPEPVSSDREARAFVRSLVDHGAIAFGDNGKAATRPGTRGIVADGPQVDGVTHRVRVLKGTKRLVRVRFCGRVARGAQRA